MIQDILVIIACRIAIEGDVRKIEGKGEICVRVVFLRRRYHALLVFLFTCGETGQTGQQILPAWTASAECFSAQASSSSC